MPGDTRATRGVPCRCLTVCRSSMSGPAPSGCGRCCRTGRCARTRGLVRVHLDQGQEGACVGFGWAHEAAARPVVRPATEADAEAIYRRAQQLDGFPDDQDGSSVLAGAKATRERGWLGTYRWAFSLNDVLATVGWLGPVVIGVNWYTGMMQADSAWRDPGDGPGRGRSLHAREGRQRRASGSRFTSRGAFLSVSAATASSVSMTSAGSSRSTARRACRSRADPNIFPSPLRDGATGALSPGNTSVAPEDDAGRTNRTPSCGRSAQSSGVTGSLEDTGYAVGTI
jgi:hypothetical protein